MFAFTATPSSCAVARGRAAASRSASTRKSASVLRQTPIRLMSMTRSKAAGLIEAIGDTAAEVRGAGAASRPLRSTSSSASLAPCVVYEEFFLSAVIQPRVD